MTHHGPKARIALALLLFGSWSIPVHADDAPAQTIGAYKYSKPHITDFATKAPGDFKEFGKTVFSKESLPAIAWIAGTTGVLLLSDQFLLNRSQELGRRLNISQATDQKTWFRLSLGKSGINFMGPFDSGSALYFIGDGWVSIGLAGGLLTHGLATSNNRSLQTASQIAEAVLCAGLTAQVLKHIAGRGSPFTTDEPGGDWRTFPNLNQYQGHVAAYDAFPSGHLTASMATLTVIAENYPEKTWIRPVGYTAFGILGFQMMNNGVHWASDYPLAIGLGYAFGKIAARRGRTPVKDTTFLFMPYAEDGAYGGAVLCQFGGHSKPRDS